MHDVRGNGVALGRTPPTTQALWKAELRCLGALALPVVIQTSAQQGMTVVDQVFLGHLGTAELGAAALANSYTNLMWFFLLGFATALDTLGSHAYGAGDRRALVTWCVTASILLSLLVAPMAGAMAMGGPAARSLFGQDEHTAALTGRFCNGLILGMWPLMWGTVLTKYLQVQNIMLLPSIIAVLAFALNVAFNAALVSTLGFRGAPLATSLSRWAQFLMLAAAVLHKEWSHGRRQQLLQHKRLRSSGDGEEAEEAAVVFGGAVGGGQLALQVLPPASRTGAEATVADRLNCGVMLDRSNCGVAQDRSNRGKPGLDALSYSNLRQAEELLLLAKDRSGVGDNDGVSSSYDGDGSGGSGAARVRGGPNDGAFPDGMVDSNSGRGSGSGASGDQMRVSAPAAALPPPPPPQSLWRTVYDECRTAMQPRVVLRFLRLGIPGGLSMSFEAGCFDFSTVLAGRLGAVATAAHAAMLSIVTLTYLACPFALATAGAIRVGNLLGAGEAEGARRAGILAVSLSGCFMAAVAIIILTTRSVLGYMFSTDSRVVEIIRDLAVFAALFQVSDGLMGSSQGVLRGCGHQHMTAVFNFTGFWIFGVLLGFLLCFKARLGIKGLWAGISTGDTATGVLNLVAMSRIRWRKEADRAVARLRALAEQAEQEQAMLGDPGTEALQGASDGGLAAGGDVPGLVGGGRSYAGGLKRMWSERRLGRAVRDGRARCGRGPGKRQDSVSARMFRSLSSLFRRQPQQRPQQRWGPDEQLEDGSGGVGPVAGTGIGICGDGSEDEAGDGSRTGRSVELPP